MPQRKRPPPADPEVKIWSSSDEIDRGIAKLRRRVAEVEALVFPRTEDLSDTPETVIARSNINDTLREVFGPRSPELKDYSDLSMWKGDIHFNMDLREFIEGKELGRRHVVGILNGLIARLEEKKVDLAESVQPTAATLVDRLHLHPRIGDVSSDLLEDGHHWEAVFAACKALINYVKEKSGKHELDGAALMRTVFSRNSPVLAFNTLSNATEQDEQEGMMHLFEGVALGIRNPGGHAFPEGSEQRALEYLTLVSMLAYRVQEAKKR